jgi:ATP-binding cassette, subfamily F, member 3
VATPPTAPAPAVRVPVPAQAPRHDRKASADKRQQLANRTRPLRNELAQIDGRLEKLGGERAAIESQMTGGRASGGEMAELGRRLNHTLAEIAMLEERWLQLQGEIETLTAAG